MASTEFTARAHIPEPFTGSAISTACTVCTAEPFFVMPISTLLGTRSGSQQPRPSPLEGISLQSIVFIGTLHHVIWTYLHLPII